MTTWMQLSLRRRVGWWIMRVGTVIALGRAGQEEEEPRDLTIAEAFMQESEEHVLDYFALGLDQRWHILHDDAGAATEDGHPDRQSYIRFLYSSGFSHGVGTAAALLDVPFDDMMRFERELLNQAALSARMDREMPQ